MYVVGFVGFLVVDLVFLGGVCVLLFVCGLCVGLF